MPNLTNALTALAGHYVNHPDLPAWHSINVDDDGSINLHVALGIEDRRPASRALVDWVATLTNPRVQLKRFKGGWAGLVHDQVNVHGEIDGQRITVHHGVTGFGDYIGAPAVNTIGDHVDMEVSINQLLSFYGAGLDDEFGVAA